MKRKKRTQRSSSRVKREKIEEYIKLEKLSDDEEFEEELRRGSLASATIIVKAEPVKLELKTNAGERLLLSSKLPVAHTYIPRFLDAKLNGPKVKLNVPLKQQIQYTKQHCDAETLEVTSELENTVYSGRLSVMPLKLPFLPRTFEVRIHSQA